MELRWDNIGTWPLRIKIMVFILAVITVLSASYLLFLRAPLAAYTHTQTKLHALQLQTTAQAAALTKENRADGTELKIVEPQPIYINPHHLAQWLGFFAQVAQQNKLTLQAAQPQQTIQANFYQELPLHLQLIGNYENLTRFITQVANLTPLFLSADFHCRQKHLARLING
jgi:type IV pilus assembly protein PilO